MTAKRKWTQNIDRINHCIFFYSSIERAAETRDTMSAVLDIDPEEWEKPVDQGPPFNLRTLVCWSAGLEIVCPTAGHEQDWFGAPVIAERGEGLSMVVFGVDDIDKANARAAKLGFPIVQTLQDSRHPDGPNSVHAGPEFFVGSEIEASFDLVREAVITPFNNTGLIFGQLVPADPAG